MYKIKGATVCIDCFIHVYVDGTVVFTSNITGESNGLLCPGGVKLTCIAQLERQNTLRWFKSINGQDKQPLAIYSHVTTANVSFPLMILQTPKVTIFSADLNVHTSEATFNSTLEANLLWFVDMNISSIECGSYGDFGTQDSSFSIRSEVD